ncbi:MAG: phage terminase large subunit [Methanothrix sp.]
MILGLEINGKLERFDLYRFAREVLGYDLLQEDPHKRWCQQAGQHYKRSLYLKPRVTYKSTIYTIADSIFRLLENPNLRILIANATIDQAQQFLGEIAGHYKRNDRLRELHFEMYGCEALDYRSSVSEKLTLNSRTSIRKEPSIGTIGALGNIVSSHYDIIKVDDLCNIQDRESPSIREKKKRWFNDLIAILEREPPGELQVVGTRWADQDCYDYIINNINPKLPDGDKYYIEIEPCWLDDGITPRFPNLLSRERLNTLKIEMGILVFSCQEELQPLSSEHTLFKLENLHTIKHKDIDIMQCERYGGLDISKGGEDLSAIVSVCKTEDNKILVFHADLANEPPSEALKKVVKFQKLFNYKKFWIEMNSTDISKAAWEKGERSSMEILLKMEQEKEGIAVPYAPVWNSQNKQTRISAMEPHYTNGLILFWDTYLQDYSESISQLTRFPMGHDDFPDVLEILLSNLINIPKPTPICAPGGAEAPSKWKFM